MAKNVMTEVAKALGLELGEEFSIGDTDKYVLLDDGLFKTIGKLTYWQVSIDNLITGEWEVVKLPKPILDEVEKKYLSSMIKPFRKYVKYINKTKYGVNERINICYREYKGKVNLFFSLPSFEKGKMYKGMKVDKRYTLEELGL